MRIKISLPAINVPISVHDVQMKVNSYVHKLFGINNEYHDTFSQYCVSSLMRGKFNKVDKTFTYPKGTYIIFSTNSADIINAVTKNIWFIKFDDKYEMLSVKPISEKFITGNNYLTTLTPILLVDNSERNKRKFITIEDLGVFEKELNKRTKIKLEKLDEEVDLKNFYIKVLDSGYNKVLPIFVNKVFNLTSQCNLLITGKNETVNMLYNLGIGQSTGSGFGTVYTTHQHNLYNDVEI